MEKTKLMLEYERETEETLDMSILREDASGSWYGYIDLVDEKASAYDRLMTGGRKSPQEIANFLGMYVVKNLDGSWWGFNNKPMLNTRYMMWTNPRGGCFMEIPSFLWRSIDYIGKWEDSLTTPDKGEVTHGNN